MDGRYTDLGPPMAVQERERTHVQKRTAIRLSGDALNSVYVRMKLSRNLNLDERDGK